MSLTLHHGTTPARRSERSTCRRTPPRVGSRSRTPKPLAESHLHDSVAHYGSRLRRRTEGDVLGTPSPCRARTQEAAIRPPACVRPAARRGGGRAHRVPVRRPGRALSRAQKCSAVGTSGAPTSAAAARPAFHLSPERWPRATRWWHDERNSGPGAHSPLWGRSIGQRRAPRPLDATTSGTNRGPSSRETVVTRCWSVRRHAASRWTGPMACSRTTAV